MILRVIILDPVITSSLSNIPLINTVIFLVTSKSGSATTENPTSVSVTVIPVSDEVIVNPLIPILVVLLSEVLIGVIV